MPTNAFVILAGLFWCY